MAKNPTVFDVAAYILDKLGPMSAFKLQKLVYYSQAWSLVWDDEPMFDEPIEAWVGGPVCPALYEKHRGHGTIDHSLLGRTWVSRLTEDHRATIDAVIKAYGKKTPWWLSAKTHSEKPWKDARRGLDPMERGHRLISHESMRAYYTSLTEEADAA